MISIIVPVYNAEKFLGNCIESILKQTYCDFELILVDDGSTDKSLNVCESYREKDSRIKVFHNNNHGVSYTRNYAVSIAQGEFIGFVDSDDLIHPEMYSILYNAVKSSKCGMAFCRHRMFDKDETFLLKKIVTSNIKILEKKQVFSSFYGTFDIPYVSCCTKLISSKLLKNISFCTDLAYGEDNLVAMECYYNADIIAFCDEELYYYRKNEQSATNNQWTLKRLDSIYAYMKGWDYWKEHDEPEIESFCSTKGLKLLLSMWVTLPESNYKKQSEEVLLKLFDERIGDYLTNPFVSKKMKILLPILRQNKWLLEKYIIIRNRGR